MRAFIPLLDHEPRQGLRKLDWVGSQPATRRSAAQGGLMAYGAAISNLFQQAATYVDRILHGAKPSELVGFPTKSRR